MAAIGSFLQARHRGGEWLVRVDDLDERRSVPGAAASILTDLRSFQMHWDGEVVYQSQRLRLYQQALTQLEKSGLTYACACSRKVLVAGIYPGTCRNGMANGKRQRSVRICTDDIRVRLQDRVQGDYARDLHTEVGDFVVLRADGPVAYHLATVVDDANQGISEVVRGSDLLESTPQQIYLQRCLGLPTPDYAHLPVATNKRGKKLSKQTHAAPLDVERAVELVWCAVEFLGQRPPPVLLAGPLDKVWEWSIEHWRLDYVPRVNPGSH